MNRRVLIAVDDSPDSPNVVRAALALFGDVETEYFAINVLRPLVAPGIAEFGYGAIYPLNGNDTGIGLDGSRAIQAAAEVKIDEEDVITETGDPARAIADTADANGIDVIVVGNHYKGFLTRLFDPSVSRGVTERASCPVLVVPEKVLNRHTETTPDASTRQAVPSVANNAIGASGDALSTEFRGHDVLSADGEKLGRITDVVYNEATNVPRLAVVDPGLLSPSHYVPLDQAVQTHDGALLVPFDKQTVKGSPKAGKDHVLSLHEMEEVDAHYGASGQRRG